MDKGLVKRDDESVKMCKENMDNQQTNGQNSSRSDCISGAHTKASAQLVTDEVFTGISVTKGGEE